jgi:pilus assembly protein CpaF
MDYLQALTSGHNGCLAVIHATRPSDAVRRLETMALYAGLNLPSWAIRQQILSGLNLIVHQDQLVDGTRKITYITELERLDEGQVVVRDLFDFQVDRIDESGKVNGRFRALGNKPRFMNLFRTRGVEIDEGVFSED